MKRNKSAEHGLADIDAQRIEYISEWKGLGFTSGERKEPSQLEMLKVLDQRASNPAKQKSKNGKKEKMNDRPQKASRLSRDGTGQERL